MCWLDKICRFSGYLMELAPDLIKSSFHILKLQVWSIFQIAFWLPYVCKAQNENDNLRVKVLNTLDIYLKLKNQTHSL